MRRAMASGPSVKRPRARRRSQSARTASATGAARAIATDLAHPLTFDQALRALVR